MSVPLKEAKGIGAKVCAFDDRIEFRPTLLSKKEFFIRKYSQIERIVLREPRIVLYQK